MDLSHDARAILKLIVLRIRSGRISSDPKSFLGYKEVHDELRLPRRGNTWGDSLQRQGLDALAFWAKDHGHPPATAVVIDKEKLSPGKGFYDLYGRAECDVKWWLEEQVPLVLAHDWERYLNGSEVSLTPHIERTLNVRGGRPRISGRRITVDDIVIMHLRLGQSIEEIVAKYKLSFADVHAALSYYFDHKEDVDRQISADDTLIEAFKRDNPSPLQEKLRALRDA
jgi:uncharacterized protein (DUF433 family)